MTNLDVAKPSPALRQPGLQATFHPRKEEQIFLACGRHIFSLPGHKQYVHVDSDNDGDALDAVETAMTISIADSQQAEEKPVAKWIKLNRIAKTSLHGVVNEDRATRQNVWAFELLDTDVEPHRAIWAAVYPFWIRHKQSDRLPVLLQGAKAICHHSYWIEFGLGFTAPTETDLFLVNHNAFWQGTGAPSDLHWLQTPVPSHGLFPYALSFTQSTSPPVLTTHPLRLPKPAPGSVVYSRPHRFPFLHHIRILAQVS